MIYKTCDIIDYDYRTICVPVTDSCIITPCNQSYHPHEIKLNVKNMLNGKNL